MSSNNTFYPTSPKLGVQLKAAGNSTTANFGLGECVEGNSGTEWIYAQAAEAIEQYDLVTIDEGYQASKATKAAVDDGHMIGAAQWAFASAEYGWFGRRGTGDDFKISALGACAADVALYTSGTSGVVDDDSSGQTKIDGLVLVSAAATAETAVECIMTYPKSTTF